MAFEVGQTVSHYRIVARIGGGGMGVVYRALDIELNRHVAIKALPAGLTSNPERRLRFRREARAAAALNHPNIGIIHETGEHDGVPFLVMELVEGRTLGEWIGNGPLTLGDWFRVSISIADGLAHAHRHGIVHRDLKPDNIMITGENQVKILDFGLAKLLAPKDLEPPAAQELHSRLETISQELTRTGRVFGTVAFMSPEQARGEAVDHRSDLFSFGILLYRMATGRTPFRGDSQVEMLNAILRDDPPPLSEVSAGIPIEADRVVRKALEKEPDRRYQHADEMATDLRNLQRDVESDRVTAPGRRADRADRRWWPVRTVAGLAVIGVLAVAATMAYRIWGPRPGGAGIPLDNPAVGILGFENLTDPDDSENLSRILSGLITTDLAETGGLRVVSTSKVLAALQELGSGAGVPFLVSAAPEAARRAGVDIMVVGQLNRTGDRWVLAAELVEVDSGDTVGSIRKETGSSAEMFALASAIAAEIRTRLAPAAAGPTPNRFDLTGALTDSQEAYRHYVSGQADINSGRWPEAIRSFDEAIALDPTFALAYYRKGIAQWWVGSDTESRKTLQDGFRHAGRLPARWQIVYRALLDYLSDREGPAYDSLIQLIETDRDIPDAYYLLGEIAFHSFRHRNHHFARTMFEKTLEIDPTYRVVLPHLFLLQMIAGDVTAARALVDRFRREGSDRPLLIVEQMGILEADGRFDEAIRIGEDLVSSGSAIGWNNLIFAHLLAGHFETAERLAGEAMESDLLLVSSWATYLRGLVLASQGRFREAIAGMGGPSGTDSYDAESERLELVGFLRAWDRIRLLAWSGDTDTAIDQMHRLLALEPENSWGHYALGSLLLSVGNRPEAERVLESLRVLATRIPSPDPGIAFDMLLAEIHLADPDPSAARAALDRVAQRPRENRLRVPELLLRARLEAAAGNPDAAIAAYRELLEPSPKWFGWFLLQIQGRYELAVVESGAGDPESARRHFQEFLDRWGDADVELPQVIDARRRLRDLEAS